MPEGGPSSHATSIFLPSGTDKNGMLKHVDTNTLEYVYVWCQHFPDVYVCFLSDKFSAWADLTWAGGEPCLVGRGDHLGGVSSYQQAKWVFLRVMYWHVNICVR